MSKKRINIALQGGGAHGAYTWGVLDRLLEEEDLEISGISGTSAGALNGAALKAGLLAGGRQGARDSLNALWAQLGATPLTGLAQWFSWLDPGRVARVVENSPAFAWVEAWSHGASPYIYGPFWQNPLRRIVESFDFDKVCADAEPALFICATRVRTGKIRIFSHDEITTDAILASACLPTLFQAVQIDDPETGRSEAYWDGGYSGNPALFPLFDRDLPPDIVVVNINPMDRDAVPVTPHQIQNRINEISFNSSLLRELRAIAFVQRLLDSGHLKEEEKSRVFIHMISDDHLMNSLSEATKMLPHPYLLAKLKEAGRASAHQFLHDHKQNINVKGTLDLRALYG